MEYIFTETVDDGFTSRDTFLRIFVVCDAVHVCRLLEIREWF